MPCCKNNLGNALQYVSSSHIIENNLRALEAYDEALKVRTARTTPLPYATTLANKANCLRNLPDDAENPASGNKNRLIEAQSLYKEAREIFTSYGEHARVAMLNEVIAEIVGSGSKNDRPNAHDHDFGQDRAN